MPELSPEYQRFYADFLSEGLIIVFQQPHHRTMAEESSITIP